MYLFGKNNCKEALKSDNISVNKILLQDNLHEFDEIINLAKEKKVKYSFVPKAAINKLAIQSGTTTNHQGVFVETTQFKYSDVEDILAYARHLNEDIFILILDEIEDPHNLGAILRTAECAGVHGVIISKNHSAQINDTVLKVSSGAASLVKVACVTNITAVIEKLKLQNIFVYGVELGGNDIYKINLKGNIALVIGSEGYGIKPLVKKTCDEIVSLPQRGKINSLNASVAAGIAIYESLRQRL